MLLTIHSSTSTAPTQAGGRSPSATRRQPEIGRRIGPGRRSSGMAPALGRPLACT